MLAVFVALVCTPYLFFPSGRRFLLSLSPGLLIGALALLRLELSARRGWVRTSPEGLTARDWLGRVRSMRWDEVACLHLDNAAGSGSWYHSLRLWAADGRVVKIGPYLWDMDQFTQEVMARRYGASR